MQVKLDDFGTGWFSLSVGLKMVDIDKLILQLRELQRNSFEHFVIVNNNEKQTTGIENIEFYLDDNDADSNMSILGGDI